MGPKGDIGDVGLLRQNPLRPLSTPHIHTSTTELKIEIMCRCTASKLVELGTDHFSKLQSGESEYIKLSMISFKLYHLNYKNTYISLSYYINRRTAAAAI